MLGVVAAQLSRPDAAIDLFGKVIAINSHYPMAHHNLGNALMEVGRIVEAVEAYRAEIKLQPRFHPAHGKLGDALLQLGSIAAARETLQTATALAPEVGLYHRLLASISAASIDDMERLVQSGISVADEIEMRFALGKAYESADRYDEAFRSWLLANALKRKTIAYDEAASLGAMQHIERAFTSRSIQGRRGHPSADPIFIIGMPRSGTSLVEQIVSSHPDVFGAGEPGIRVASSFTELKGRFERRAPRKSANRSTTSRSDDGGGMRRSLGRCSQSSRNRKRPGHP